MQVNVAQPSAPLQQGLCVAGAATSMDTHHSVVDPWCVGGDLWTATEEGVCGQRAACYLDSFVGTWLCLWQRCVYRTGLVLLLCLTAACQSVH